MPVGRGSTLVGGTLDGPHAHADRRRLASGRTDGTDRGRAVAVRRLGGRHRAGGRTGRRRGRAGSGGGGGPPGAPPPRARAGAGPAAGPAGGRRGRPPPWPEPPRRGG